MSRQKCRWCNEEIDEIFYNDQPSNVCRGCWEIVVIEEKEQQQEEIHA